MTAWEYLAVSWSFDGPMYDQWPKRHDYEPALKHGIDHQLEAEEAGLDSPDLGPDIQTLDEEYEAWRTAAENAYLNDLGSAEYELVALHREVLHGHGTWPYIRVRAYFKRESRAGSPTTPPNPIGFRVRSSERAAQRQDAPRRVSRG